MENFNRKNHWENIYGTKELQEVSWYQPVPETSLNFLGEFDLPKTAKIIDVGGGDSYFTDHLLELGYEDVTVLDISEAALERAKQRLGNRAEKVKWIVADAATFVPDQPYDFWHDRAAFHFLTGETDILHYSHSVAKGVKPGGFFVLATFSEQGPKKCSGIEIKQYSEDSMTSRFDGAFEKIRCLTVDHPTPFDTTQNFVFCAFRKRL